MEESIVDDDVEDMASTSESEYDQTSESEDDQISESDDDNMEDHMFSFSANPFFPFKNEFEMLALLFFKSGQDNYSHRLMKNILAFAEAYCKAAMKARGQKCGVQDYNSEDYLPAFTSITKSHLRKKSRVPVLRKDVYPVQKGDTTYEMTLNKPSEFIQLLLGNPEKCKKLASVPDRTPNCRTSLNQGHKWLYDPEFRCPMVVGDIPLKDLWIGDIVKVIPLDSDDTEDCFMISNFFCSENIEYCETFQVSLNSENSLCTECTPSIMELSSIDYQSIIRYQVHHPLLRCRSITEHSDIVYLEQPLINHHYQLLVKAEEVHSKAVSTGVSKVKIIPLTLFSDDTSGNTTKKWNCYDSWIMTPAAMPLSERNMYENQFFLCTHHDLNAMETGSRLVDNLKSLEDGMIMFDLEYEEKILVYAPVLFITADNVRHAEICCSKGAKATCPCRKCYWQVDPAQNRNRPVVPLHTSVIDHIAVPRLKVHMNMYAVYGLPTFPAPGITLRNCGRGITGDPNESTPISETSWGKLGYKLTGGEVFLTLKAFDPTKDTPVEMLHVMLLGIMKYIFNSASKNSLDPSMLKVLENGFRSYDCKAFSRKLNSKMSLHKSFLGRDFKITVQTLPCYNFGSSSTPSSLTCKLN